MEGLLTVIHYGLCLFLIISILLQAGKGADIGAAFGAGSSQTLFGPRGAATFLNKLTVGVAAAFLLTSLTLAHLSRERSSHSVFETVPVPAPKAETIPLETAPAPAKKEAPKKP